MNSELYDLALAKFLQTEPVLGNYIVTYKDISDDLSSEAGVKVGVFILKAGKELFYVPVVSKGESIYPIDSVFCASTSMFHPLTKKTVEWIVNSNQTSQGKGMRLPSNVVTNPDMTSLINPPRTGKYVAASSSRLNDFLAAMPDHLKTFTMEKISQEKSMVEEISKLFNIQDLFAALRPTPKSLAAEVNTSPISVLTGAAPSSSLSNVQIREILDNGYSVTGTQPTTRIAIAQQEFNDMKFSEIQEVDGNSDYELVFSRGTSKEAFIPKMMNIGAEFLKYTRSLAIFTDSSFAISESFIAKGTKLDRRNVIETLFNYNPPVLPKDLSVGETFVVVDTNLNAMGVYVANGIILSNLGTEISASARAGAGYSKGGVKIHALKNYGTAPTIVGSDIYIPSSSVVIRLGKDVSYDLEKTINSAARRNELHGAGVLGDQLNLGFDGVEFSINGSIMGKEANVMERLVVEEGIDPVLAQSFVKQARERKFTKIYLSKKASQGLRAGEIPQFGDQPVPQGKVGLNGSLVPNIQSSLRMGDAQATESVVISELLQAPDMLELVEEYLPDLEDAIDKLGRILFLSRVHITQISENNDVESLFSFLAQLKAVYKMLGDNVCKLKELITLNPNSSDK